MFHIYPSVGGSPIVINTSMVINHNTLTDADSRCFSLNARNLSSHSEDCAFLTTSKKPAPLPAPAPRPRLGASGKTAPFLMASLYSASAVAYSFLSRST